MIRELPLKQQQTSRVDTMFPVNDLSDFLHYNIDKPAESDKAPENEEQPPIAQEPDHQNGPQVNNDVPYPPLSVSPPGSKIIRAWIDILSMFDRARAEIDAKEKEANDAMNEPEPDEEASPMERDEPVDDKANIMPQEEIPSGSINTVQRKRKISCLKEENEDGASESDDEVERKIVKKNAKTIHDVD